jgi:hypothetical protein
VLGMKVEALRRHETILVHPQARER